MPPVSQVTSAPPTGIGAPDGAADADGTRETDGAADGPALG